MIARESFRSRPLCNCAHIKEVDAAVKRRLDQFIGPILANGADGLEESFPIPECHGSETEFRNRTPASCGSPQCFEAAFSYTGLHLQNSHSLALAWNLVVTTADRIAERFGMDCFLPLSDVAVRPGVFC
jgi:hypothetical protein